MSTAKKMKGKKINRDSGKISKMQLWRRRGFFGGEKVAVCVKAKCNGHSGQIDFNFDS